MAVTRQPTSPSTAGRVNQKRRTRLAIVEAAQRLVDRGVTPTVAQAAEEAMVSRTTAYRYFPTQESLLLELTISIDMPDFEHLPPTTGDPAEIEQRLLEVFERFNRHVFDHEELYRRALRTYLDLWLAEREASGERSPTVRAGRRTRWIADALEPVRASIEPARLRRLEAALCLVTGIEAMVVLRDVSGLDPDEALDVMRWAGEAIVRAGLDEEPTRARARSRTRS